MRDDSTVEMLKYRKLSLQALQYRWKVDQDVTWEFFFILFFFTDTNMLIGLCWEVFSPQWAPRSGLREREKKSFYICLPVSTVQDVLILGPALFPNHIFSASKCFVSQLTCTRVGFLFFFLGLFDLHWSRAALVRTNGSTFYPETVEKIMTFIY